MTDETFEDLQQQITELHRAHPTSEMKDAAWIMTRQLDIALHDSTWARPQPPAQVWLDLLREVAELRTRCNTADTRITG